MFGLREYRVAQHLDQADEWLHAKGIVIPIFQGRQGNPVIFSAGFFSQLRQLKGDVGGRVLFNAYPEASCRVPVETCGVCFDLDTPEDYQWLCQQEGSVNGH